MSSRPDWSTEPIPGQQGYTEKPCLKKPKGKKKASKGRKEEGREERETDRGGRQKTVAQSCPLTFTLSRKILHHAMYNNKQTNVTNLKLCSQCLVIFFLLATEYSFFSGEVEE